MWEVIPFRLHPKVIGRLQPPPPFLTPLSYKFETNTKWFHVFYSHDVNKMIMKLTIIVYLQRFGTKALVCCPSKLLLKIRPSYLSTCTRYDWITPLVTRGLFHITWSTLEDILIKRRFSIGPGTRQHIHNISVIAWQMFTYKISYLRQEVWLTGTKKDLFHQMSLQK